MTRKATRLVLVGCGRMGGALLESWCGQSVIPYDITIIDDKPPALPSLATVHRVEVLGTDVPLVSIGVPHIVVFALKPQTLASVLPAYHEAFGKEPLYLTIAAGKDSAFYQHYLGADARLIRIMPNTPAIVGLGVSAMFASPAATDDDRQMAEWLMNAAGVSFWVQDEIQMHAVTAVSGSGPAYVFYFMECMIRAAIDAGLEESIARKMVLHTVHGSAELAVCQNEPLDALRQQVTSPGGTTESALERLMHPRGLLPLVQDAVQAAILRSRELAVKS